MPVSAGRPTINDVAVAAGVTRSVVSRALTGTGSVSSHARERVLAAAAELRYQPNTSARTLVTGRSRIIGALARKITDPWYAYVIAGLQQRATEHDYRVLTVTGNLDTASERKGLQTLLSLQVDGVVIGSGRLSNKAVLDVAAQTCAVMLGRDVPGVDVVDHDEAATAAQLFDHLRGLGHRNVGFLAPPTQYNRGAVGKTRAVRTAAAAHGITLLPENAANDYEPCVAATARLIDAHPEMTAVVGMTSFAALGAMTALEASGLQVPDEVSVACFIDPLLGGIAQLGITGVLQAQEELGHGAVDLIIERLSQPAAPRRKRFVTGTFIAGTTTAPVRSHH